MHVELSDQAENRYYSCNDDVYIQMYYHKSINVLRVHVTYT